MTFHWWHGSDSRNDSRYRPGVNLSESLHLRTQPVRLEILSMLLQYIIFYGLKGLGDFTIRSIRVWSNFNLVADVQREA